MITAIREKPISHSSYIANLLALKSYLKKRRVRVTSVPGMSVLYLNPRYDSGRTHPYHPNRARFFIFLFVKHAFEKDGTQVPFCGIR